MQETYFELRCRSNYSYLQEAKRDGVKILPLDLNHSNWDFTLEDQHRSIRVGLRSIKGILRDLALQWIQERKTRGHFRDFNDFVRRTGTSRATLIKLAHADVFASLGLSRRDALWAALAEQGDLPLTTGIVSKDRTLFPQLSLFETIAHDYQTQGLSHHAHPMLVIRDQIRERHPLGKKKNFLSSRELKTSVNGMRVVVAGVLITLQKPPTAKGVAFGTLEDETGFIDLVIWPDVYARVKPVIKSNTLFVMLGKLQRQSHATSLIVERVWGLEN